MTDDFYDLFNRQPPRPDGAAATHLRAVPNGTSSYAAAALRGEAEAVATAPEGARNHTLNKAWFNMGRHVGAGNIDADTVRLTLTESARAAGLPEQEIETVLRDGPTSALNAGAANPRVPAPLPDLPAVMVLEQVEGEPSVVEQLLPILDWHDLWNNEDEEEWILEPILPVRRAVALYSAPKVGKSLLMLEIAVGVARGTGALGVIPDRARRVLYVDFENDPRGDIRTRLEAMDVGPENLDNLCYLSFPSLAKLDTPMGGLQLVAAAQHYECEVVVIDTVSRAVQGEENVNDTWLAFYRNTGLALKALGIACIRLDHTGKNREKGMRGGSAKYGDVDVVWKLEATSPDTLILECTDHRMPMHQKFLTLTRQSYPLRHLIVGTHWSDTLDVQAEQIDKELDALGVPSSASVRDCGKRLREAGKAVGNVPLSRAVKARKLRLDMPSDVATDVPKEGVEIP